MEYQLYKTPYGGDNEENILRCFTRLTKEDLKTIKENAHLSF